MYSIGIIGLIPDLKAIDSSLVFEEGGVGGSGTYLETLVEKFVKDYSHLLFVKVGTLGCCNKKIKREDLEVNIINTHQHVNEKITKLYRAIYLPIKTVEISKHIGYVDIYHTNNFIDAGFLKSLNPKSSIIYTVHGALLRRNAIYNSTSTARLLDVLTAFRMKNGIKHGDAIITVGKGMDPELYSLLRKYEKKAFTIPNGVDVHRFHPTINGRDIRRKYQIPNDAIVVISASRFSYERRTEMLIKAFYQLRKKYPKEKLYLLLVGTGPREREIKDIVNNLNLKNYVIFTGPKVHAKMPKYYAAADIAFNSFTKIPAADKIQYNSSLKNAFKHIYPISISFTTIESMASGLPVIAVVKNVKTSWSFKNKNFSDDCGIVVSENDFSTLVGAFEMLIKNPDLREDMGKNARDLAVRERNVDKMIKRTVEIYDWVLSKK